ncbi:MAG: hypothetical protein ACFE8C_11560, partial [Promethearchaeota archaeon]
MSQTIKFGLLDAMGFTGEGAWQGAYTAARQINEGGGVTIGGVQYWVGLVANDTKEGELNFDTAIAAANDMVGHNPHVCFGGVRKEVLSVYQDIVMAAKLPFLITGCAAEELCKIRVGNSYDFYKYTFRFGLLNNPRMGVILGNYVNERLIPNITDHIGYPVNNITVVYENRAWTVNVFNAFQQTVKAKYPTMAIITEIIPAGG